MNRCVFQIWEESERGWGVRPDGCSIHLNKSIRDQYINNLKKQRSEIKEVPNEYDRPVGNELECFVSDMIYDRVSQAGTIRLFEYEKNNLIKLGDLIFKPI